MAFNGDGAFPFVTQPLSGSQGIRKPTGFIINGDDFGYSAERDEGLIEAYHNGSLTSFSLLVNGATAESVGDRFRQSIREREGRDVEDRILPIGLHINLTEGKPVSPPWRVSSLLRREDEDDDDEVDEVRRRGKDGTKRRRKRRKKDEKKKKKPRKFFFRGKYGLRRAIEEGLVIAEEVRIEVYAQLRKFVQVMRQAPTHFDGHNHCHVLPLIRDVIADIFSSEIELYDEPEPVEPAEDVEEGEQLTGFDTLRENHVLREHELEDDEDAVDVEADVMNALHDDPDEGGDDHEEEDDVHSVVHDVHDVHDAGLHERTHSQTMGASVNEVVIEHHHDHGDDALTGHVDHHGHHSSVGVVQDTHHHEETGHEVEDVFEQHREVGAVPFFTFRCNKTRIPEDHSLAYANWVSLARMPFLAGISDSAATARETFQSAGIIFPRRFIGLSLTGSDLTMERFERCLRTALRTDEGEEPQEEVDHDDKAPFDYVVEYMTHPGYPGGSGGCGSLEGCDDFNKSTGREIELNFLLSDELRTKMEMYHLKPCSYEELIRI